MSPEQLLSLLGLIADLKRTIDAQSQELAALRRKNEEGGD